MVFLQKVRVAIKSSQKYPLTEIVYADEFVIGGKEDGKQVKVTIVKKQSKTNLFKRH